MNKEAFAGRLRLWSSSHEAVMWIMALLLIAGTMNVFSSTFVMAENESGTPYTYMIKQLAILVVGLIAFIVSSRVIDYHKWRDWLFICYILVAASLVLVLIIGPEVNGAKRWIYIGSASVQPSEFAKACVVLMESYVIAYYLQKNRPVKFIDISCFAAALLAVLVEQGPDLGTAAVVMGVPVLMKIIGGLPNKITKRVLAFGLVSVIGLCIYQPYRLERLQVWFDPWADAQETGYQAVQSMTAVGSGGFWGMGLGKGLAKYAYLPEAHTDYAFAVFCQENGFLLAVFIVLLFALLAYYGVRIARDAVDAYGQVLAGGIMVLIVGQAIFNMMMILGLMPVVGVPLPFISYGGSSLVVSMFMMGILVNISRYTVRQQKQQARLEQRQQIQNGKAPAGRPRLTRIK